MKLISEFKAFAMRGNVVDMAVGIIIGGAFGENCKLGSCRCYYASNRSSVGWCQVYRPEN